MSGQPPGPRRVADGHLELVTATARKDAEIVVTRADDAIDPFLAFESERDPRHTAVVVAPLTGSGQAEARPMTRPAAAAMSQPRRGSRTGLLVLGALLVAALAAGLTYAYLEMTRRAATGSTGATPPVTAAPPPAPTTTGTVSVTSLPEGARVLIDGTPRGVTPLRVSLPAGSHTLEIEHLDARRSMPVALEAGATSSHYFDLTAAAPTTGRLEVTSDPPGATVTIDGTVRGVTPLVLPTIAPGSHRVVIANRDMTSTRTVTVNAGATATLVVPLARVVATTGFVSVQSPIDLDIFQDGTKIGSSVTNVRLAAGRHSLELLNASLEFRTTVTVDVPAGGTASAVVTVPRGKVAINATPWAEVLLDGRPIGQTPLANLEVPIGTHELIWRHPQLGERRQTVVVKAQSPNRFGMDLNR